MAHDSSELRDLRGHHAARPEFATSEHVFSVHCAVVAVWCGPAHEVVCSQPMPSFSVFFYQRVSGVSLFFGLLLRFDQEGPTPRNRTLSMCLSVHNMHSPGRRERKVRA